MKHKRKLIQLSTQNRCITLAILVFLFLLFVGPHYFQIIPVATKVEYICIEDPETRNTSGLENVIPLPTYFENKYNVSKNQNNILRRKNLDFTTSEKDRISSCVKNYAKAFSKGQEFWSGTQQEIRRTHHTYLVPGESIIVEVGGNVGEDAQVLVDTYKPKYYIVLEPLKFLYRSLQQRFKNYTNVITYNVGLGAKYEKFMIKMEGNKGGSSSQFHPSGEGTCTIKVVNATDFFIKLAVDKYKIDLITINCEGCEYDLLETLVSTELIFQFRHIQFATHSELRKINNPVKRYCELHELLGKSHKLTYQYKFQWEAWKLKDV